MQRRVSMRTIREVLRLRHEAKLSMHSIAVACKMSSSTVSATLSLCKRAGLGWPLPEGLTDDRIEQMLYRDESQFQPPGDPHEPDWKAIQVELRKRKNVTLTLLWEEYKTEHPDGYQYSWFCEKYGEYRKRVDPVMRQTHRFGEKCFVDYAGETMMVIDRDTGEVRRAQLFVGVLGASNYTYAEATWSQELCCWLSSHVRMFEFFGGTPEIVVPDNLKSGVRSPDYYEPDLNPAYHDLATHYGVAILPARVRKPRDKAKAEGGVLLAERWIIASLRNRNFYGLDELNRAISEKLHLLNTKPFQRLEGCRRTAFENHEKPLLRALPASRYQFAQWKRAKVNIDYHIDVMGHYYSVPYQLTGAIVDVRVGSSTVEILHGGVRVTSHIRSSIKGGHTTLREHMPSKHAWLLDWTPERVEAWAEKVGPSVRGVVVRIMASRQHPQQGFRASLGVIRLAKEYGADRVEAACQRALATRACSYRSIRSILQNGLDRQPLPSTGEARPPVLHENLRGAEHYAQIAQEVVS